ncbi:cyclic nucleotide-binding domain-containing protein [Sphaerotilus montanus]|jgi:CRP-like cAMP-binding protein|uniref:CRP-like cAMP-binding protein n=1 Tax=Sphaerotilus montanus TaxID=522889 RepID=A0A7Y9QYJ7_9BURK|nr:cyclic nucleotide-binding domain-containing protein [Sphaerotilus montanus]NYG32153.1 CRP-like cAMP-binding protein [Sphaerotilus montanus]NZD57627.1 cyclic nucleotide-binding domain-containing protein [Sphaerotilus montanus]
MGIDELIEAVQSYRADDAFRARLDLGQWRQFAAYLTAYQLRAGDLLIKQNDCDRAAYFVGQGTLQVYVSGAAPGTSRIALMRPGALVGETGLFSDQPHSANVEAMTPSIVWALHLPRFEELTARAPLIANEVLRAAGAVMVARLRASLTLRIAVA